MEVLSPEGIQGLLDEDTTLVEYFVAQNQTIIFIITYDAFDTIVLDISRDEFLTGLDDLENYIARRYLTNEPTNYLNKMFPTLWRDVDQTQFTTSLRRLFVNRNYPNDSKVKIAILTQEMYDKRIQTRQKINLILDTINRHLSKGSGGYTQLDANPTIEHIMPQTLNSAWKEALGQEWQDTYRDYFERCQSVQS